MSPARGWRLNVRVSAQRQGPFLHNDRIANLEGSCHLQLTRASLGDVWRMSPPSSTSPPETLTSRA